MSSMWTRTTWWASSNRANGRGKLMRRRAFYPSYLVAYLGVAVAGFGQQGHPLTGTWNGDWGAGPDQRTQVTIVMAWDGKDVNAVINPGPDSAAGSVTVDVVTWTVRIAA